MELTSTTAIGIPLVTAFCRAAVGLKLLVKDTAECSGRCLVLSYAAQWTQLFSTVHVFSFDTDAKSWLSYVPPDKRERLVVHDGFSDPFRWDETSGGADFSLHQLLRVMGQEEGQCCSSTALVFDSISSLLLHHSSSHVCRVLHQLGAHGIAWLCLVHSDLHDSHVIQQLSHVTNCSISVSPAVHVTGFDYQCVVMQQRKSGKVMRKEECFSVDEKSLEVVGRAVHTLTTSHQHQLPPDPTSQLTFDLSLSAKERKERGELVLPYTRSTRLGTGGGGGGGGGGVYYQPDEGDDLDDSDPDDDLDI